MTMPAKTDCHIQVYVHCQTESGTKLRLAFFCDFLQISRTGSRSIEKSGEFGQRSKEDVCVRFFLTLPPLDITS